MSVSSFWQGFCKENNREEREEREEQKKVNPGVGIHQYIKLIKSAAATGSAGAGTASATATANGIG